MSPTSRTPSCSSTRRLRFSSCSTERSRRGTSTDERSREEARSVMARDRTLMKVSIFTVAMLLVAAFLVVVFGEFRFASDSAYHATFTDASRLKAGQDVRIAGVPVGSVNKVSLNPDNTVDVAFDINKRYQLYTSTRAVVRYENLVGDRYLEIGRASCRERG